MYVGRRGERKWCKGDVTGPFAEVAPKKVRVRAHERQTKGLELFQREICREVNDNGKPKGKPAPVDREEREGRECVVLSGVEGSRSPRKIFNSKKQSGIEPMKRGKWRANSSFSWSTHEGG